MTNHSLYKLLLLLSFNFISLFGNVAYAQQSVEEARLDNAAKIMPEVVSLHDKLNHNFKSDWLNCSNISQAKVLIYKIANSLWLEARQSVKNNGLYDDRSLYWQRLKLSKIIRTSEPKFKLTSVHREALLTILEKASRGIEDLAYTQTTDKRILLTGFDPFLLDRNINQSNPSGVVALLLDGMVIHHNGVTAEINTVMIPVRYKDFDDGMIESLLAPFYLLDTVDLITTVSMGRKNFDLERFPGRRRSASAPDNLNVYSGGTKLMPVVSMLGNNPLPSPEFVEFNLPVKPMQKASGSFKTNDNRTVSLLKKSRQSKSSSSETIEAESLESLAGTIAVSGSGGGYLSNEISFRSIRLQQQLGSDIPTGHIHTPRIKQYQPDTTKAIVEQITEMLKLSLTKI